MTSRKQLQRQHARARRTATAIIDWWRDQRWAICSGAERYRKEDLQYAFGLDQAQADRVYAVLLRVEQEPEEHFMSWESGNDLRLTPDEDEIASAICLA